MATKRDVILEYIESLRIGERISVRGLARKLEVSEGTAYRAIKEAEIQGLVSAMDRIGTVRIEQREKQNIERLTFAEVVNVLDATVIGGRGGLHKMLHKFVIGAMEVDAMLKYLEPGSLMIVGNREHVQKLCLEQGAAVLITGGFAASEEVQELANQRDLPLLSCAYDTFSTATLINRAIYDQLIKRDIIFVEDVVSDQELAMLNRSQTVRDYFKLVEHTGHARIPVVDEDGRLAGIVTARDVAEVDGDDRIDRHMSHQVVSATLKTTVASAAHQMVWEGIEMLPVVHHKKLVGVISRQDVIKALQLMNRQPQAGETLQDSALQGFDSVKNDDKSLSLIGEVAPQMISAVGTLAIGPMTTLIENCSLLCVRSMRNVDMVVENVSLYFLKPVPVDCKIEVRARVMDFGRRFAKLDVEVLDGSNRAAKALVTVQMLER